jgi:cytochrome c oxidase assembly factor CtaG
MVGRMVVWDIAAILLIVATPLVLIVADRFGNMILAAVQRRRRLRWIRHHPPPRW